MSRSVVITCAVTGSGDTTRKSPHVPVTPTEIAASALDAAKAGAAVVHLHVRNPATGAGSRDPALFREVVSRIRDKNSELVLNLTGGMGGELVFGYPSPLPLAAGTDFVGAEERMAHMAELAPDIGSLDIGSTNFDDVLYGSTPSISRRMALNMAANGIRPEIEAFELGHIELAKQLINEGVFTHPVLFQLCLGVKYAAPATPDSMKALRDALPPAAVWSAFGVGRQQIPMVAQAVLMGGHVRVGLEDNLYLEHGVLASNAQLVQKAATVIHLLGERVASPSEARKLFGLRATNVMRHAALQSE